MRPHPNIPWIHYALRGNGFHVACMACRTEAVLTPEGSRRFIVAHSSHQSQSPTHLGLGDVVAKVAAPVARVLGLPAQCTPCEARKAALNARVPAFWRR